MKIRWGRLSTRWAPIPVLLTVVFATLVSTGPAAAAADADGAPTDPNYVALGDSYSSGEGLAPFISGTDSPTDRCHRSTQAYSQRTTPRAGTFAACSGQDSGAFSTGHQTEPPQGSRLSDRTSLVSMTFGGNDLDWPGLLTSCTKIERELLHNLALPFDRKGCDKALATLPQKIDGSSDFGVQLRV
ncbi:hypothetical protein [Actinomycetospora soli]|uniref:hypothetical protein n=1 Tax=Actinomycetospora soli TaxID=2893887 RepID=UPI001E4C809F|nr:hypothetical protein [Actinomycetospora soli]MCD2191761.1 hypothetical protein [Actinomycetospora soli]